MKKNIVIKMSILLCVALTLFGIMSCALLAYNDNKLIGDNLISLANGYAGALKVSDPASVIKYDTNDNVRVTIINSEGKVLADSYGNEESMENHLNREEIVKASHEHNTKIVKRHSVTGNTTLLYFAKKVILEDGSYNYLRVSMEAADLSVYLTTTIVSIVVLTVIIIILSSFMANAFTKGSLRPLETLATNLESIKNGTYAPIAPSDKYDEMNIIFSKINDISDKVASGINETNIERDKLNNLLENMSQAVIACDKSDEVIFCNSRAKELFECQDMIGKTIMQAMREPCVLDSIATLKNDDSATVYFDKKKKNYRVNITKPNNAKSKLATIILVTDITKLKIAEHERREFFANASHELKTPLTAIKGYSELISTGIASGDKAKTYGANISDESQKLLDIINDMLVLSRLDENVDIGVKTLVNIREVASNVVDKYSSVIATRGIKVDIVGEGSAYISRENMYSILSNIISNAIKYNKDNGAVDINIERSPKFSRVSIKDSGVGISKVDLPRVTERFYKADASRSVEGSTGLGLAIVKHLCELNRVEYTISSELNVGTEWTLKFNTPKDSKSIKNI